MPDQTPNLGLTKPDFNQVTWHDEVNGNFDILDSVLGAVQSVPTLQIWENNTAYLVDDFVIDPDTSEFYQCLVAHISAATGTFADDRVVNPTYWILFADFATLAAQAAASAAAASLSASSASTSETNANTDANAAAASLAAFSTLSLLARFALYSSGLPGNNETLVRYEIPDAITFPAGMTLSLASSDVAATASAVFSVQKNGVTFATITFAAAASDGTFIAATPTTFAAGDLLTVIAPTPQDATLSGVSITLSATRVP